jgi:hypothetical protein
MISREAIEAYRKMGPERRLAITLEACQREMPALFLGTPEVVRRRFALLRKQNNEFNERLIARMNRYARNHEEHS